MIRVAVRRPGLRRPDRHAERASKRSAATIGRYTGPRLPAKAKHVIFLFMAGGPSQVDMFDPKPALLKYQGQRPDSVDLRTERQTGGLLPSPFACSNGTARAASKSASCCRSSRP